MLARTVSLDVGTDQAPATRRIETQLLHREEGSWRPYTYIWNTDQTDAVLADAGGENRTIALPGGKHLAYRFAARSECGICHNPWVENLNTVFGNQSASPLAFDAAQLDRDGPALRCAGADGSSGVENQLRRLERLGYFDDAPTPSPSASASSPHSPREPYRLVDPYDEKASLNLRARSYLEVNCGHCHLYGAGGSANIFLGAGLPIEATRLIEARPLQGAFGIDDARIIAPGEPERSVLYYRVARSGAGRMPRLGSRTIDDRGVRLIGDWIASLSVDRVDTEENLPALAPVLNADAVRSLTRSTRGALGLVRRIDRGAVPPTSVRQVVAWAREDPRAEVRDLFERFIPATERVERLGDAIDPALILNLVGDPARGRDGFFAPGATQCRSCHRIGGVGVALGPDLDAIGTKYEKAELLRQTIEPSRSIDPKYMLLVIATTDGQVRQGLLIAETSTSLTLRDAQNQAITIPIADIDQRTTRPTSMMPDGLLRNLTAQQAADLLAFLSSLKEQEPSGAERPDRLAIDRRSQNSDVARFSPRRRRLGGATLQYHKRSHQRRCHELPVPTSSVDGQVSAFS